jgi:hypothetical protein
MCSQTSGVIARKSVGVIRASPFGHAQNALHHEGIDVDHAILKQMKAEHAGLVILMAVAGELAALGEKDEVVSAVPLLDDVEAFVNLAA